MAQLCEPDPYSRPAANRLQAVAQRWRAGMWASAALMLLAPLSLAPHFTSSTELVRMRNALLLDHNRPAPLEWTPNSAPADFLVERGRPDPMFADAAARLGLAAMPTDWDRAVAISRHLLGSQPTLTGGAIQSDLRTTYRAIVDDGTGYCSDFVRAFMALAISAEIPVRAWAFSFDGFGGHGHTWPEIWNRQAGRWQALDVFNNLYFVGPQGVALSALEVRRAMLESPESLRLVPLHPGARPGWKIERKAWDYYRAGLPEWYLWWGSNVFTYDRAPLVRGLYRVSRSLEQLGGIAHGTQPRIHILETPENAAQVAALRRLRMHLLSAGTVAGAAALALVGCAFGRRRARRRAEQVSGSRVVS